MSDLKALRFYSKTGAIVKTLIRKNARCGIPTEETSRGFSRMNADKKEMTATWFPYRSAFIRDIRGQFFPLWSSRGILQHPLQPLLSHSAKAHYPGDLKS